ncbi:hypothetical protein CYY_007471 [Polysphondylium violaceum]|uniref:FNIP repeat-containing protein n=1 Tax=Polysphondylium violaceum TaxID=133409 RepID=A0A8J4UY02_9MYCE|nr:hypothetical protein CYY_007471 [Polysphondylium violaceum]
MKFLTFAFLLLLSVSASLAGSCFDTTGFHSNFTATAFNAIVPLTNGFPLSYFEAGTIDVDFVKQQIAVTFDILTNDNIAKGQLFGFAANQTMYVVNSDSNGISCAELPLNLPIPTKFPNITANLGPINIGKFQTEVYEVFEGGQFQKVLYDLQNCAVVSSYMINNPSQPPGVTNVNFLNFVNTPAPISLPSLCTDPSMNIKLNKHAERSVQTPKSIQQLLRPFLKEFNPITGNFDVETQVSIDEITLSGFNSPTKLESQGHLFKSNIKKLSFKHFKSIIPKDYLPSSLQELELLDDKTLLESNSIPLVKTLKLNSKDDIDNNDNSFDFKSIIPKSVEILHIGGKLEPSEIPSNVKEIHINMDSNYGYILKPNTFTKVEQQYPPYNKTNNLFLYLWRINRLKGQIHSYNYRTIFTPPEHTPQHLLSDRFTFLFRNDLEPRARFFIEEKFIESMEGIQNKVENFNVNELKGIKYIKSEVNLIKRKLPSVTHLDLINYYNPVSPQLASLVPNAHLPDSLTYLNFLNTTKNIPNNIPSTIKHLVIYTSNFKKEEIPSSVQTLEVRDVSILSVKPQKVPSTVQRLLFTIESYQNLKSNDSIHPEILSKCSEGQIIEIYKQGNPISTKTTTLIWCDNKIIEKDIIPNNVKRIIFGNQFNQLLVEGTIPSTITEINFGISFNQSLKKTYLPPSLTYLSFGKNFNQPFDKDTILPNLCYLTLKQLNPKQSLSHLPPSVSHLLLENIKEMKLDLPSTVKHLKVFSKTLNLTHALMLPSSIQSLHTNLFVGFIDVEKDLEPNVDVSLTPTSDIFASNIKIHLYSQRFDKFIKSNSLISNIYSIDFGNSFRQPILPGSLPPCLKKLRLGDSFNRQMGKDCIPSSVETLYFGDCFNQPLNPGVIPLSVTDLDLGKSFNQDLEHDSLPSGLKKLRIPFFENFEKIVTCIPSTVEELTIANGYQNTNRLSCNLIPLSIKTLNFEPDLCVSKINTLPPNVKKLSLCDEFKGFIPQSVESVQLPASFDQPLNSILCWKTV